MNLPGIFFPLRVPLEFCSSETCHELSSELYDTEEGDVIANEQYNQLLHLVSVSKKKQTTRKRKRLPQTNTKKKE